MAVLAIDQGTSGTKAIVVRDDGVILGDALVSVHPTYGDDGSVEVDPVALWQSVLDAGHAAIAMSGVVPTTVALANQGETVLAWEPATGRPLSMALVWQDRRAQRVCDERRHLEPRIRAVTGLELDPYFSAPKMTWLREHVTTLGVVTTSDSWLVHQLCGAFVTDVSTASRSLVFDVANARWDHELVESFGLRDTDLPRLVSCDEVVGETTVFGSPMKVGGLIVDQAAALLAQGCVEHGMAKCTFGTGAFLLVNAGDRNIHSSAGLTTSLAWQIGPTRRYYMDGQVYAAGSALRWLTSSGVLSATEALDNESADDAHGVFCVPSLAGLAAPWWRPDARGSVDGLSLATERGHLIKAVLDGIGAQIAQIVEVMGQDLSGPLDVLRVDGGLTQSRQLLQSVADIAQVTIEISPQIDATARGAALLARIIDGSATLDDATATGSVGDSVTPKWSSERALTFRSAWRERIQPREGN